MATGKVARRTAVEDVRALLDSPEITALIAELDALRWTGRKGYGSRALVGACLVKTLFALPTWTWVAALIKEHPGLQAALGGTPSVWACYRFARKLRENRPLLADCLDRIATSLREQFPDIGRDVAIDASDLPAYANGHRFVRDGGPERERYSDPDASWGHRSAVSTRGAGSFYGYKIHVAVCTRTELPLAWRIETAKRNESLYIAPLLDALHARGFRPDTDLYKGRGAVERTFGRLKDDYGLTPLRVRGLERVQLHADLTILARLSQALARARELPLAA
jgi:hypothetical protein